MADIKKSPPAEPARQIAEGIAKGLLRTTRNHFGEAGAQKVFKAMQSIAEVVRPNATAEAKANPSLTPAEPAEESEADADELADLEALVENSEHEALLASLGTTNTDKDN